MHLEFRTIGPDDAAAVWAVRVAAARDLTARHGLGPWSGEGTPRGVAAGLRHARIWLAHADGEPAATFRLATRKPWSIDRALFTPCARPLYLTDMAVAPAWQRRGVGRRCLAVALAAARDFPAQAVWLDAFDAAAGAGAFYARCGFAEVGRAPYRGVPHRYFERAVDPVSAPPTSR
ncbi:GNAT family N-acetyltransferase [Roseisolibacter sp. H3M3-2]|uniref:GNAT family N-acetyltransferase n=1 Tax=Roseisolibacter sp. H3M3-2 TaxID=3031323 RepID=UPI0023DAC414|nr:GNAT family N-acetyltransferase [Roseisolibacter sp. H3M3-2]MDF1504925.1 GNAT family N-acetyltransferase [Roseisolibacter sp. H3M3-2]